MVCAKLPDKLLFIRVLSVFIRGSITFFRMMSKNDKMFDHPVGAIHESRERIGVVG